MITEDQARLTLRNVVNYIIRSLFDITEWYSKLKEKDEKGGVVLPYLFLKKSIFVNIEDHEELGIKIGDDPEQAGRWINRLIDEVLETYFLDQPLPDKEKDELVYVSGYLPDEENGRISLLFATLLYRKANGEQELDENERFFVDFIEEYGKPEYLTYFAAPGPKLQNKKYKGWEKRFREYMDRIQKELGEKGCDLKNRAEEQLTKKLSYVSGEETRGNTYDQ